MCKLKNNEKGITLIALIITIIVMLILVGVTINVALNGGIFQKAEIATQEMERAQAEELIIASYVFDDIASDRTILSYLDMPATGREIYKNLTTNGFKLKDENGNDFATAEAFISAHGGEAIVSFNLNIQGKHGQYNGNVGKKGLGTQGVTIKLPKEEPDPEPEPPSIEGLKMEPNTNYVFSNPPLSFVMNLTDEGYITIKAQGITLLEEKVSEKMDTETGKVKGIFSIPDVESYEVLIYTNNEDDNDTNVYLAMGEEIIKFEKVLPRGKINVYTGEIWGATMVLIEISETEAIVKISNMKPQKYEIEECTDLRSLSGNGSYNLENNGISYSRAATPKGDKEAGTVYNDMADIWYSYGIGNNTLQVSAEVTLKRDITMSEEEIQAIINEVNAETN